MPREFKPIYRTKVNDIYIRVDKVTGKCNVPNCKETDCYDIQIEQPEGLSFMGGVFCKNHLECIFNFPIVESEVQDADSLCDSCINHGCIFQSGIVRNHCDFYKAESED